MLEKLTLLANWRCFKAGREFIFRPGVNLLVGDQGSGKSSLLELLGMASRGDKQFDKLASIKAGRIVIMFFDFEKHNPRTKSYFEHTSEVSLRFKSHGESCFAIFQVIEQPSDDPKLFIMDEPDMALSIRSIFKMVDILKKTKHQVVLAVHNPLLIQSFPEVLSVEHGRWMPSAEFIELEKVEVIKEKKKGKK